MVPPAIGTLHKTNFGPYHIIWASIDFLYKNLLLSMVLSLSSHVHEGSTPLGMLYMTHTPLYSAYGRQQ